VLGLAIDHRQLDWNVSARIQSPSVNTFLRTAEFDAWLKALRDPIGTARVIARIRSAEAGNFGDCEPVGDGISEMRIHVGPGYRLYYYRKGDVVYLLLCGGSKSTQSKDIKLAKALLARLENQT
jgi:putative addiction module killer protein